MPFHTLPFLFGFLPLLLVVDVLVQWRLPRLRIVVLTLASVAFLLIGDVAALILVCGSLIFNFGCGMVIVRCKKFNRNAMARVATVVGVIVNILLLSLHKYAASFSALPVFASLPVAWRTMVLPLGISFYSFSQISYLLELLRGTIEPPSFLRYCFFVLFFPKFIAGPIASLSCILAQVDGLAKQESSRRDVLRGISFLLIGLFKKVVIADQLAHVVAPLFLPNGSALTMYSAWFAALSYGLQLYFDFSGYSDMAIGIALLFGIALPINFDCPYTAVNIAEFWRKWHRTLGMFFQKYVYIPLGGNRRGWLRKCINLFIVMVLVGVWHGSSMTFVIWGALHGLCLVIHTWWTMLRQRLFGSDSDGGWFGRFFGRALTFVTVTMLWVFFRADSIAIAVKMLQAMVTLPARLPTSFESFVGFAVLIVPLSIVWFFPTTQAWLGYRDPERDHSSASLSPRLDHSMPQPTSPSMDPSITMALQTDWKHTFWRGLVIGSMAVTVFAYLSTQTQFIYGNF